MALIRSLNPSVVATRWSAPSTNSFWCFTSIDRQPRRPGILADPFDPSREIAVGFERYHQPGSGPFPCIRNLNTFCRGAVRFDLSGVEQDWLSSSPRFPVVSVRSAVLVWDFVRQLGDPAARARIGCVDAVGDILVSRLIWRAGEAPVDSAGRNAFVGEDLGIGNERMPRQGRAVVSAVVNEWLWNARINMGFVFVGRSEEFRTPPELFTLTPIGGRLAWGLCADVLGNFRLEFHQIHVEARPPPPPR